MQREYKPEQKLKQREKYLLCIANSARSHLHLKTAKISIEQTMNDFNCNPMEFIVAISIFMTILFGVNMYTYQNLEVFLYVVHQYR